MSACSTHSLTSAKHQEFSLARDLGFDGTDICEQNTFAESLIWGQSVSQGTNAKVRTHDVLTAAWRWTIATLLEQMVKTSRDYTVYANRTKTDFWAILGQILLQNDIRYLFAFVNVFAVLSIGC